MGHDSMIRQGQGGFHGRGVRNRLVHIAHPIEMRGDRMRKNRGKAGYRGSVWADRKRWDVA
jgi:hypothetical protein